MVVVSIIVSIIMTITPKGAMKATIGVVSGLLIVTALLNPLISLKKMDLSKLTINLESQLMSNEEELFLEQDNLLKEIIVDKTSAYILAKAQALDVDCEVIVTLDDSSPPLPNTAVIKAKTKYNPTFQQEMSVFMAFDCGISKENQHFEWE